MLQTLTDAAMKRNVYRLTVIAVLAVGLPLLYWQFSPSFISISGQGPKIWPRLSTDSPLYLEIMKLSHESATANTTSMACRNTVQGKHNIADSKGYVCPRDDVDLATGCCNSASSSGSGSGGGSSGYSSSGSRRFECTSCSTKSNCCSEYEGCVSCCLAPENFIRFGNYYLSKKHLDRGAYLRATSIDADTNRTVPSNLYSPTMIPFDYCSYVCRTSSDSIQSENSYRGLHNNCFGVSGAPLETITVNSDWMGVKQQKSKGTETGAVTS